jgi:A/G-specific adenine glycosylase
LRSVQVDIEDLCNLCEPLQLEEAEEAAYDIMIEQDPTLNPSTKGRKRAGTSSTLTSRPVKASKPAQTAQRSLRDFASFASLPAAKAEPAASKVAVNEAAQIVGYCSLFPKREQKKLVPEQECIVCIIQRQSGEGAQYLIEQRPPKGLLASLWQFPTYTVSTKAEIKAKQRKEASLQFVQDTFAFSTDVKVKLLEERGSVMHVFSHLKLEMFIHLFILNCSDELALAIASKDLPKRSWVDKEGVDQATLSTGMKRCWEKLS